MRHKFTAPQGAAQMKKESRKMKLLTNGLLALALTLLAGASALAQQSQNKKQLPPQGTEQAMNMDEMMKGFHDRHHKRTDSINKTAEMVERAEKSSDPAQMRAALIQTREMLAEVKNDMDMCMTNMHSAMKGMKMQGAGGNMMSDKKNNETGASEAIDPVCNMKVDPKSGAAQATYKGKTYYFCKAEHKAQFEKNPEQYIKKQ